jgi:hypothetical protein
MNSFVEAKNNLAHELRGCVILFITRQSHAVRFSFVPMFMKSPRLKTYRGPKRKEQLGVCSLPGFCTSRTGPTERKLLRGSVLIKRCPWPESPIALRATFRRVRWMPDIRHPRMTGRHWTRPHTPFLALDFRIGSFAAIGERRAHIISYLLESRHQHAQYAFTERTFPVTRYVKAVSRSRHQPLEGRSC